MFLVALNKDVPWLASKVPEFRPSLSSAKVCATHNEREVSSYHQPKRSPRTNDPAWRQCLLVLERPLEGFASRIHIRHGREVANDAVTHGLQIGVKGPTSPPNSAGSLKVVPQVLVRLVESLVLNLEVRNLGLSNVEIQSHAFGAHDLVDVEDCGQSGSAGVHGDWQ